MEPACDSYFAFSSDHIEAVARDVNGCQEAHFSGF